MASESPVATLVDSNVLLDVATDDQSWAGWSSAALSAASGLGPLVINPIVYAEVSAGYDRIEAVDSAFPEGDYLRAQLPWDAAFLAGKAFVEYRRRGGARRSPLPDFFIGAHAAIARMRLLTRDADRYRTYFPTVKLLAPDG